MEKMPFFTGKSSTGRSLFFTRYPPLFIHSFIHSSMDGSLAELQRLGYEGGNVRQLKLITLHSALSREAKDADIFLKGHYKRLLLSLKRLMESYGPSPDYERWVDSISAS